MASASNNRHTTNRLFLLHSQTPNNPNPNPNPTRQSHSSHMAEPIITTNNNNIISNNNNNDNNNHASSSAATAMDESDSDSGLLARSEILTRQEVLSRRSRRLKRLAKVYREHYWAMMEDVKAKFREYYWDHGKSPFLDDAEGEVNQGNGPNANGNAKLGLGLNGGGGGGSGSAGRCEVHGCKAKAMSLTKFCHAHILSDAKQKLYKGCGYATKSSATGPTLCMKPILRSTVPSLCPLHLEKAEKHVTRALRKAGLNVTSTSKLAPKFHVVVAEYVRQIQSKRRAAQKALGVPIESKEGNAM